MIHVSGIYCIPDSSYSKAAINFAAENGHFDIVQHLINNSANVNPQALINAAEIGHLEMFKYLIANGADMNYQSYDTGFMTLRTFGFRSGFTAPSIAAKNGHLNIIKYIFNQGN